MKLRALLPGFYSPRASFFHYLHMARGNIREYLQGDVVWLKKYFYVLRPLLSMLWIEKGLGPAPIEFNRLLDMIVPDGELRGAIDLLLDAKKNGAELDRGPAIPTIGQFIQNEMERIQNQTVFDGNAAPCVNELSGLFRTTLDEVWAK